MWASVFALRRRCSSPQRLQYDLERGTRAEETIKSGNRLAHRFISILLNLYPEHIRIVNVYLELELTIGAGYGRVLPSSRGTVAKV